MAGQWTAPRAGGQGRSGAASRGKAGPVPGRLRHVPRGGWERTSPCPLSFSILSGHVLREVSGDPFLSVCHMSVSPYLSSTIGLFVDIYHLYLYHVSCLSSINYLLSIYLLFISICHLSGVIYLSINNVSLSIYHASIHHLSSFQSLSSLLSISSHFFSYFPPTP